MFLTKLSSEKAMSIQLKKKRMNFTWHKHFVPGFQEKIVGNVVLMGC